MRYRWTILTIILVVVSLIVILKRAEIVTGPEVFLPGYKPGIPFDEIPDEDVQALVKSSKLFGDNLMLTIVLFSEDGFSKRDEKESVEKLVEFLSNLKEVKYVLAFTNAGDFTKDLISEDGNKTMIMCSLNPEYEPIESLKAVENVLKDYKDYRPLIFGEPVIDRELFEELKRQNYIYPPLIFLMIFLVFYLQTRSILGSSLAILIPIFSSMMVMAINFLLNNPLNTMTAMVSSYLMIIGSAYGLHFYNAVQEYGSIEEAFRRKLSPIVFSMLTTVAGFMSFVFLKIRAFREFSVLVSSGLVIVTLLVFTVMKELVKPIGGKPRRFGIAYPGDGVARTILIVLTIVAVLSPFFISRIEIGGAGIQYFRKSSDVIKAYNVLRDSFGFRDSLYVIVEKNRPFLASDGKKIEILIKKIEKLDGVTNVVFPLEIPIPMANILKTRYPYLGMFVSGRAVRIIVNISDEALKRLDQLRSEMKEIFDDFKDYNFTLAGTIFIWNKVNREVLHSQLQSMTISFVLILGMISFAFRNLKLALFGMIPIMFTTLMNFVNMGMLKIHLDTSTSIVASMLMGLTIDYSIHVISDMKISRDPNITVRRVGPSIVANALGIDAGFFVLLFSTLKLFVNVSILTMLGTTLGAFLTLTIIPFLTKRF